LVRTRVLDPAEASMSLRQVDLPIPTGSLVLEHQRADFPSFPYEWPAEMLHAAGTLTVELARAYLDEGIGLKDATPYNVLFDGPCPLVVDVLSFEERDPLELTWGQSLIRSAFTIDKLAASAMMRPMTIWTTLNSSITRSC